MSAPINLRSRDAYRDRAWDWGFLNDCFGPGSRIRFSDIDGIAERHGYFLVIEAKPGPGFDLGQRLLLDALSQVPCFTVVVLYGEPNKPTAMQHWPGPQSQADEAAIKRFVSEWFRFADRPRRAA